MADIYIIRHGQDKDNAKGILNGHRNMSLTLLGRKQANNIAKKLQKIGIQVIYSSPLARAYETAQIIANKLKIKKVIIDKNLIERDFGILTGKPITDISKYSTKRLQSDGVNYFLDGEGTEDFLSVLKRANNILEIIRKKHPDKQVLLVTHGDIGKTIRAAFHGWSWEKGLTTPYLDNIGILELRAKEDEIL